MMLTLRCIADYCQDNVQWWSVNHLLIMIRHDESISGSSPLRNILWSRCLDWFSPRNGNRLLMSSPGPFHFDSTTFWYGTFWSVNPFCWYQCSCFYTKRINPWFSPVPSLSICSSCCNPMRGDSSWEWRCSSQWRHGMTNHSSWFFLVNIDGLTSYTPVNILVSAISGTGIAFFPLPRIWIVCDHTSLVGMVWPGRFSWFGCGVTKGIANNQPLTQPRMAIPHGRISFQLPCQFWFTGLSGATCRLIHVLNVLILNILLIECFKQSWF